MISEISSSSGQIMILPLCRRNTKIKEEKVKREKQVMTLENHEVGSG